MLRPAFTTQFKKDLKKMLRRGKDEAKLKTILTELIEEKPLEPRQKDHKLPGTHSDLFG